MKSNLIVSCILILFLLNIQSYGQKVLWKKKLDTESFGESISMTKAGNFLIGGDYAILYKSMIASFDYNGNKLWERKLCDTCKGYPYVIYSKELEDGRILFITSNSNVIIVDHTGAKIDSLFNLSTTTGYSEKINKVFYANNQLFIYSNHFNGQENLDLIIRRINLNDFKIIYQEIRKKQTRSINLIGITNDSSIIECQSSSNLYKLRKINSSNQILWEKTIPDKPYDISDLIITSDQRIFILRFETNLNKTISTILQAFNENGESIWQKQYDPYPSSNMDDRIFNYLFRIKETHDGNFVMIGSEGVAYDGPVSSVNISKINAQGELLWKHLEWITGEGNDASDFIFDKDQNLVVVGTGGTSDFIGENRAFILKMTNPNDNAINENSDSLLIFPNPSLNEITIKNLSKKEIKKIEVYNIEGKLLKSFSLNGPTASFRDNFSDLAPGIYFFKIYTSFNEFVKKFIKL